MELSKDQIKSIEKYLTNKKVDYIDLKIEILDHMIADVEQLLQKGLTFSTAFARVKLKWNVHFRERSSFFLGMYYSIPKIVLKKAVSEFKPYWALYMVSYFLPFMFITKFKLAFSKEIISIVNPFVKILLFTSIIYLFFIMYKIIKYKVKTTYSFILRTQYLSVVFLIIPFFFNTFFEKDGRLNGVSLGLATAGISVTYICHHFYKKHLQEIQKLE